ncbi:conserved hypothetical protein [Methylocella silvestris BL2]|uniref:Uncharacterized protein n=1 Tax=Methylocella silvestris (strain DSM 15510 / CIP 108128 / LMG 27833 / NCIMB 13906 / BL2) TaxID=395965 RepID=B8ETI4_METSB|nr:hypothetical protein [Methylocella silvestris]ACK52336.1 conserved hypothetical protein [Methylocella silvestris BL2]
MMVSGNRASTVSPPVAPLIDDNTFDVLNAIYLHKMATPKHVAEVSELAEPQVESILKRQQSEEAVIDLGGSFVLGEKGTAKVLAFYREVYAPLRAQAGVIAWYDKFETSLNQQFIKAVSDWQTSAGDDRAREKMTKLVERMIRTLRQITSDVSRYEKYANRFARAMALADRGEDDFVCKPTVDSMHNIWFEFHEDILALIGRPRDV